MPASALLGRSVGGLGGRKLTFRPQLFWQEVLPEHKCSSTLQFECDIETGKNFARLPVGDAVPADGSYARSVAVAVPAPDVPPGEASMVERALREAATFAGSATPLQHLLSSLYCPAAALQPARRS